MVGLSPFWLKAPLTPHWALWSGPDNHFVSIGAEQRSIWRQLDGSTKIFKIEMWWHQTALVVQMTKMFKYKDKDAQPSVLEI